MTGALPGEGVCTQTQGECHVDRTTAICKPRRGGLGRNQHCHTLISDSWPAELRADAFLSVEPPSLWNSAMVAWASEGTQCAIVSWLVNISVICTVN